MPKSRPPSEDTVGSTSRGDTWQSAHRMTSELTFDQLFTFRAVAEVGSFRAASARLYVSQPAISQKIQHLEAVVGARLFQRQRGVGVTLTAAGRLLLEAAHDMTARLDRLGAQLRLSELPLVSGTLAVTAPSDEIQYALLGIMPALRAHHPGLRVIIRQAGSRSETLRMIQSGTADVALYRSPAPEEVKTIATVQDWLHLASSPGHPLARTPYEDRAAALQHYSFAAYALGMRSRALVERWAAKEGAKLNVDLESRSVEIMKQAAVRGLSVTFLPKYAIAEELAAGQLVTIAANGLPLSRATDVVIAPDAEPSPAVAALVAAYVATLSTLDTAYFDAAPDPPSSSA